MAHYIPQTQDGLISDVTVDKDSPLVVCTFKLPEALQSAHEAEPDCIRFTARSRIARLGIDLLPDGPISVEGDTATLALRLEPFENQSPLLELLPRVLVPGVPLGRLVACPKSQRMSATDVYESYVNQEFQLPASFSIDASDRFTIQPHRIVYHLSKDVTEQMLLTMLMREEGKALLNRIQVPTRVDNIVVPPKTGVITSCSMYLHRHYVALATDSTSLGRHTHAQVLDPVTTRGRHVFLEIFNHSDVPIVNPIVTAEMYRAGCSDPPCRFNAAFPTSGHDHEVVDAAAPYLSDSAIRSAFSGTPTDEQSYFSRPIAIVDGSELDSSGDTPMTELKDAVSWHSAAVADNLKSQRIARLSGSTVNIKDVVHATDKLSEVPANTGATLLLSFFPNLCEHNDILNALRNGKVNRIVFKNASFEHGAYLSARDQARLADYADFGAEVHWFNPARDHVAAHIYRGHRGFFCEQSCIDRFLSAIIVAVYGSSVALPKPELAKLDSLIQKMKAFFGPDLALLTGGGPGVMRHVAEIGHQNDLLVGANYLEIESQDEFQVADFYQTFQETSRHMRQRWFEISSFAIFCIGGFGTLEEVGMTLTDIKLGVAERMPLIFFGRSSENDYYWKSMRDQLCTFIDEERGPAWIGEQILVTDDPDEVIDFYQSVLELG